MGQEEITDASEEDFRTIKEIADLLRINIFDHPTKTKVHENALSAEIQIIAEAQKRKAGRLKKVSNKKGMFC